MRYMIPLLILSLACSEPTGTPSTPAEADWTPRDGAPAGLVDCDFMINVGPVIAVTTPATLSLPYQGEVNLSAQVYRDNTSIPGIQYHCQDYDQSVTFTGLHFPHIAGATYIGPQTVRLEWWVGGVGGWEKWKAAVGTKADTTKVTIVQ